MKRNFFLIFFCLFLVSMVFHPALVNSQESQDDLSQVEIEPGNQENQIHVSYIRKLLDTFSIGQTYQYENLTLLPLQYKSRHTPDEHRTYLTLNQVLENQLITITELENASVPKLKLQNKSKEFIFLMTGDVLSGAKQDRILAHDILLSPQMKEIEIPVYCVELGRWEQTTKAFTATENIAATDVRSSAAQKAGQAQVWDDVGEINRALGQEENATMQRSFQAEQHKETRENYKQTFSPIPQIPGSIGVVAAINGKIVSADIFLNHQLFKSIWPKLLEAFIVDTLRLTSDQPNPTFSATDAKDFLSNILQAKYEKLENSGLGTEFAIGGNTIGGSVLFHEQKVVHCAIFPYKEQRERSYQSNQQQYTIPDEPAQIQQQQNR